MRYSALTASPSVVDYSQPGPRVACGPPTARSWRGGWAVRESAAVYVTPGDMRPEATEGSASPGGAAIDLLSAAPAKVHGLLKTLHACGNEIRLVTLGALHAMYERCLYFELGYTSYYQYCDRELGLPRSTAYEYLRAAKALAGLPQLREQFRIGEVSWVQVRAITRVATAQTEVAWIKFAWDQPVRRLLAEVREAQRTGRDAPRERRHGLPNLLVRHVMELTLEEMARVRVALALVAEALDGGGQDGAEVSADGLPLVRWADGVIAGSIPIKPLMGGEAGARPRPRPAQTIVYHVCPACRQATVQTDDGPVSVPPERVHELAEDANRVDIDDHGQEEVQVELLPDGEVDAPNSPGLTRKVLHRDGLTCANPGCGRRHDLQAHHIVFRSKGGRTVLSNEVALCGTCHAMIHQGLLQVSCSSAGELAWTPRPLDPTAKVRHPEAVAERVRALAAHVRSAAPGAADAGEGALGRCAGGQSNWPGAAVETGSRLAAPWAESTRETGGVETAAVETGTRLSGPWTESTPETGAVETATVETGSRLAAPWAESTREPGAVETGAPLAGPFAPRRLPPSPPPISERRVSDLARGLRRLGYPLREAQESVREAMVDLVAHAWTRHTAGDPPPAAPTDEEILLRALRGAVPAD